MNNKEWLRNIISTSLSVILTCLFTVIFLLLGIYYGYFNQGKIISDFTESKYYENSYAYISSRVTQYAEELQVPEENLFSVITFQKYYANQYDYAYNKVKHIAKIEKTTIPLRDELLATIQTYDEQNGIIRDEASKTQVSERVMQLAEEYQATIELGVLDYIDVYQQKVSSHMITIVCVLIIGIVGIVVWLLSMYRRKYRAIRFVVYALTASLGLIVFVNQRLLTLSKGYLEGLTPVYYKSFVELYFRNGYTDSMTFGIIMSSILILIMLCAIRLMKKPIRRERGEA